MVSWFWVVPVLGLVTLCGCASSGGMGTKPLSYTVKDIDGHDVDLATYRGKVVMIVNVASKCGFTPQYAALEAIYKKYKDPQYLEIAQNLGEYLTSLKESLSSGIK